VSAISNEDVPDDSQAWLLAREWLYDREALSACPDHTDLLGA